jgi:hypothetical protein
MLRPYIKGELRETARGRKMIRLSDHDPHTLKVENWAGEIEEHKGKEYCLENKEDPNKTSE